MHVVNRQFDILLVMQDKKTSYNTLIVCYSYKILLMLHLSILNNSVINMFTKSILAHSMKQLHQINNPSINKHNVNNDIVNKEVLFALN
jgi:hypothetical protein